MAKKKNKPNLSSQSESQPIQRVPFFDEGFREDLVWWVKTDIGKANKIMDLISDVMRSPFTGIGKPEPLKYLDADTWSRRIDLEHRLVYRVKSDRIDFLACRYHY